jgi:integrase
MQSKIAEGGSMKLPNGYGTVEKLPGNRRRPYAVKVSYWESRDGEPPKRRRKNLAYFEEKKQALAYLAEYNAGHIVKEHEIYSHTLTFSELFDRWMKYKKSLKNGLTEDTWKNYKIAFNLYAPIHHKKINIIRAVELQECITANNTKSRSMVGCMRIVLKGMWNYALLNEMVDKDITQGLVFEHTDSANPIHTRFTDKEIKALWEAVGIVNNVDIILIYIYTGVRPAELLEIKREDVHLDERYMIGGLKTDAGHNRIMPLHEAIVPFIKERLDRGRPYLITNKYGNQYTRAVYHNCNFNTVMANMQMNHTPHDTRYTFAALADNAHMNEICKKIIMGHSVANKDGTAFKTGDTNDVTSGIYTEKTIKQLVDEVNLLPTVFEEV